MNHPASLRSDHDADRRDRDAAIAVLTMAGICSTFAALTAASSFRDSEVFSQEAKKLIGWLEKLTGNRFAKRVLNLARDAPIPQFAGIEPELCRGLQFGEQISSEAYSATQRCTAALMPDDLLDRLDEYARRMERLHGLKLSRSQQIKSLVELGLEASAEAEVPPPRKR